MSGRVGAPYRRFVEVPPSVAEVDSAMRLALRARAGRLGPGSGGVEKGRRRGSKCLACEGRASVPEGSWTVVFELRASAA